MKMCVLKSVTIVFYNFSSIATCNSTEYQRVALFHVFLYIVGVSLARSLVTA
jgi:hypothetical protein